MDSEQLMEVFQIAVYISIAVTILGFGSAIYIFFRFDIPMVYALMTGKIQAKTIEKMMQTGDYKLGNDDSTDYKERYKEISDEDRGTESIGNYGRATGMTASIGKAATTQAADETTLLQAEAETTLLATEAETMLLSETEQPGFDAVCESDMQAYFENTQSVDSTQPLTPGGYRGNTEMFPEQEVSAPAVHFVSIEHTLLVHTDEVIE